MDFKASTNFAEEYTASIFGAEVYFRSCLPHITATELKSDVTSYVKSVSPRSVLEAVNGSLVYETVVPRTHVAHFGMVGLQSLSHKLPI